MSKTFILSVFVKVYSSLCFSNFVVSAYGSIIKLTSPFSFVLNCLLKTTRCFENKCGSDVKYILM